MVKTNSEKVMDYRQRRKQILVQYCWNKCCLCGYNKEIGALEFHHLDPTLKKYGIASKGHCHNIEEDFQEVEKCILVCANCHREIENGWYSQEELSIYQQYDIEYKQQILNEYKEKQNKTLYFCQECGKQLSQKNKNNLCLNCYHKSRRTVERPSREELKQLIRNIPFTKIGKQFGVSDKTITDWCVQNNLPSKKSEIKLFSAKEWEEI